MTTKISPLSQLLSRGWRPVAGKPGQLSKHGNLLRKVEGKWQIEGMGVVRCLGRLSDTQVVVALDRLQEVK